MKLTEKNAYLYIRNHQDIHISWILPNGEVMVFQQVPSSITPVILTTLSSLPEYLDTILGAEFITLEYVVCRNTDELLWKILKNNAK